MVSLAWLHGQWSIKSPPETSALSPSKAKILYKISSDSIWKKWWSLYPQKDPRGLVHSCMSVSQTHPQCLLALSLSSVSFAFLYLFYFLSSPKDFFFPIAFRDRKGQRKGEKHQYKREALTGCLPHVPRPEIICTQTRDRICKGPSSISPDQEWNPQTSSYRTTLQQTEPHRPVHILCF